MPRARQKQRKASRASATTSCSSVSGYTGSNFCCGQRVQIKRQHKDTLFGGRNGVIIVMSRANGMTMATVQLDRGGASKRALRITKPIMELALLDPGEWRLPRQFDPRPEHQTVYGTIWG